MPLVYFGRKTLYHGRPLWEILFNLKNFGIGRIVTRSTFKRYPEVTYYRILDVQPSVVEYPENMKGTVLVQKTFRGVTEDAPFDVGRVAFKPDFRLIPKHEEEAFINSGAKPKESPLIHPRYMEFPPLWQELIKRDKLAEGKVATPEDLRCLVQYHPASISRIRIAEEGEKPSYEIGDFIPVSPNLFKGIRWNREEQPATASSS